jgi:2-methylcitrate dehydratase PrpD
MSDSIEQGISTIISQVRFEDLTAAAAAAAKRSTLDVIAAMVAGSTADGLDTIVKMALQWGGAGEATLVGFGNGVPAPVAAWCNGTMARALEIDDCVDFLPVHPSASAVPALLALAQLQGGMTGRDFITALVVGQDMKIRMGLTVRKNAMESGRNNMFKIFGPTAAISRAMNFSPEQTQNALGLSFSFAVGDGQCALDGALSLRLQQGIVAQGALLSGLLTAQGFTGAKDFLMGRFGYLRAYEPDPRLEFLRDNFGKYFYGEQITIKPFSACRATHASIELALRLRPKMNIQAIDRIFVHTCPGVYGLVAQPWEVQLPDSAPGAQFSIQFTVAAALLRGDLFLGELDQKFREDSSLKELARKVIVQPDPALATGHVLGKTIMEIQLQDGSKLTEQIELPLGNPSHPMTYGECAEKFSKCAKYSACSLSSETIAAVADMVDHLEELPDVAALISRLC